MYSHNDSVRRNAQCCVTDEKVNTPLFTVLQIRVTEDLYYLYDDYLSDNIPTMGN